MAAKIKRFACKFISALCVNWACMSYSFSHRAQNTSERAYFPVQLLPQLKRYTRMSRVNAVSRGGATAQAQASAQLPQSWSPSAIRKMNSQMYSKRVNLNLCYLGEHQCIGSYSEQRARFLVYPHRCRMKCLNRVGKIPKFQMKYQKTEIQLGSCISLKYISHGNFQNLCHESAFVPD